MAAAFSVKFNTAQIDKAIQALGAQAPKAIARAINRSVVTTRAVLARDISGDTGLKVSAVKEQLKVTDAQPDRLIAQIRVSGKPIPLIDFKARQTRTGVTARLPGTKRYQGAFIARMKSGHRGVFKRVPNGKRRGPKPHRSQLPIYELHGPSLPKVFTKFTPSALKAGEESLQKNLAHELSFALKQSAT